MIRYLQTPWNNLTESEIVLIYHASEVIFTGCILFKQISNLHVNVIMDDNPKFQILNI
jgi:hypothetical protein